MDYLEDMTLYTHDKHGALPAAQIDGESWFDATDIIMTQGLELEWAPCDTRKQIQTTRGANHVVVELVNEYGLLYLMRYVQEDVAKEIISWLEFVVIPDLRRRADKESRTAAAVMFFGGLDLIQRQFTEDIGKRTVDSLVREVEGWLN